jgi:hypothetical protein
MLDDWQPGDDSKPRCPRDLFTVSRSTFIPDPLLALTNLAEERGERVRNAFLYLVSNDGSQRPLTRRILQLDEVRKLDVHAKATIVAGVMLGFPVPTYGNLLFVLRDWVDSRRLWDLQQDIVNSKRKEWNQPDFDDATKLLRNELLKTMRKDPAPYEIWRTEVKPDGSYGRRVVVGLGSAMADGGDHMLMFGGSRDQSSEFHTPHACPGYPMAMGVMLGAATALLTAGALRPTPDPVVVTVTALDEKADGAGNGKPDSLQPANKEIPRRPL